MFDISCVPVVPCTSGLKLGVAPQDPRRIMDSQLAARRRIERLGGHISAASVSDRPLLNVWCPWGIEFCRPGGTLGTQARGASVGAAPSAVQSFVHGDVVVVSARRTAIGKGKRGVRQMASWGGCA
jgi:hypothetical protein